MFRDAYDDCEGEGSNLRMVSNLFEKEGKCQQKNGPKKTEPEEVQQ